MTDKNVSEAAWTLITSFQEANQAVAEHLVSAQERNRKLAERFFTEGMEVLKANQAAAQGLVAAQERTLQYVQGFFNEGMEVLKSQAESMRALLQELDQQIRKQHEALQTLAYAPVEATLDVLRTPLAAYQKALGMAETVTRQGLEQVQQATEQVQQATQQTHERHGE
jgi:SMC interacting uncharacterized protein involved in chromosome segregation